MTTFRVTARGRSTRGEITYTVGDVDASTRDEAVQTAGARWTKAFREHFFEQYAWTFTAHPLPEAIAPSDLRVVFADDEAPVRNTVRLALRQRHIEPVLCRDGWEAMAAIRQARPHVAILDLGMPGQDGLEIARQMLVDLELKAIPIILLTCRTDIELMAQAASLGVIRLNKPFGLDELLGTIEALARCLPG